MTDLWLEDQAEQLALEAQEYNVIPGYKLQLMFRER